MPINNILNKLQRNTPDLSWHELWLLGRQPQLADNMYSVSGYYGMTPYDMWGNWEAYPELYRQLDNAKQYKEYEVGPYSWDPVGSLYSLANIANLIDPNLHGLADNTGKYIFYNTNSNLPTTESLKKHEITHALNGNINGHNIPLLNTIDNIMHARYGSDWIYDPDYSPERGGDYYYDNPDEIYARLMSTRYSAGLNPSDIITKERLLEMRDGNNVQDYDKDNLLNRYDDDTLLRLFNEVAQNNTDDNMINYAANGGSIHINPKNRGKFNATKKRTGKTTEELTHSKNPLTRKRAVFALNARRWRHDDGGYLYSDGSTDELLLPEGRYLIDNNLFDYTLDNVETYGKANIPSNIDWWNRTFRSPKGYQRWRLKYIDKHYPFINEDTDGSKEYVVNKVPDNLYNHNSIRGGRELEPLDVMSDNMRRFGTYRWFNNFDDTPEYKTQNARHLSYENNTKPFGLHSLSNDTIPIEYYSPLLEYPETYHTSIGNILVEPADSFIKRYDFRYDNGLKIPYGGLKDFGSATYPNNVVIINPKIDKDNNNDNYDFTTTLMHEVQHTGLPREELPDNAIGTRIPPSFLGIDDFENASISDYLFGRNSTETGARIAQVLNHYGIDSKEKLDNIDGEKLEEMFYGYLEDGKMDNNISDLIERIGNWDLVADWMKKKYEPKISFKDILHRSADPFNIYKNRNKKRNVEAYGGYLNNNFLNNNNMKHKFADGGGYIDPPYIENQYSIPENIHYGDISNYITNTHEFDSSGWEEKEGEKWVKSPERTILESGYIPEVQVRAPYKDSKDRYIGQVANYLAQLKSAGINSNYERLLHIVKLAYQDPENLNEDGSFNLRGFALMALMQHFGPGSYYLMGESLLHRNQDNYDYMDRLKRYYPGSGAEDTYYWNLIQRPEEWDKTFPEYFLDDRYVRKHDNGGTLNNNDMNRNYFATGGYPGPGDDIRFVPAQVPEGPSYLGDLTDSPKYRSNAEYPYQSPYEGYFEGSIPEIVVNGRYNYNRDADTQPTDAIQSYTPIERDFYNYHPKELVNDTYGGDAYNDIRYRPNTGYYIYGILDPWSFSPRVVDERSAAEEYNALKRYQDVNNAMREYFTRKRACGGNLYAEGGEVDPAMMLGGEVPPEAGGMPPKMMGAPASQEGGMPIPLEGAPMPEQGGMPVEAGMPPQEEYPEEEMPEEEGGQDEWEEGFWEAREEAMAEGKKTFEYDGKVYPTDLGARNIKKKSKKKKYGGSLKVPKEILPY